MPSMSATIVAKAERTLSSAVSMQSAAVVVDTRNVVC